MTRAASWRPARSRSSSAARTRSIWWGTGGDPRANSRRLRGRALYVQLTPGPALWPEGPAEMRASTVSATPVSGAVILAGIVTSVPEEGYVRLDCAFAPR